MKKIENSDKPLSFFKYFSTNKKKIWLLCFSGLLYAFTSTSLMTKAATIPAGLSAISMTLSFILPILKPYLNFLYLLLNIPFFLFYGKKIKRTYIYGTLIFLVVSSIFGFFIGFDFGTVINGKEMSVDFLISQYIFVFCPPISENEILFAKGNNLNNLASVQYSDYLNWLEKNNIPIKNEIKQFYKDSGITIAVKNGWPIFVYMSCAVFISAFAGAIAWKSGGSTGGTDIIAYYYSTKSKKSVGLFLTFIGLIILLVSLLTIFIFVTFGSPSITRNINGFKMIISLQTLSSLIYVIVYGKILNMFYPKYNKVIIRIDTINKDLIKNFFTESKFHHPYKIYTLTSGKTGSHIYTFETIVLVLESEVLIEQIKKVDPSAWISKLDIRKTYGNFNYSSVE